MRKMVKEEIILPFRSKSVNTYVHQSCWLLRPLIFNICDIRGSTAKDVHALLLVSRLWALKYPWNGISSVRIAMVTVIK
jgi:hypothetical protein